MTIGVVEADLERRIHRDTTFKGDAGTDNGVVSCEMHDTGDAGAFYIGRDWSQRGNVIRYNHFHDLVATLEEENGFNGVMAVCLDDQASGTSVFGNLFGRVNCGVMVGGGRDDTVANSIFAFCGRAIHLDARGVGEN